MTFPPPAAFIPIFSTNMSSKARSQTTQSSRPWSQDYLRKNPHHTHFLDDYQPSLFVSPIDCDVSRGFLLDYFEQFGRVRSVTVKQGKFHDFAIIHFDHWHLQFSERLREDLYNGVPAKLLFEDRRRERHTWKVSEYKERERQVKPVAAPATKAPAPTTEELRMAKSKEAAPKVETSFAKVTISCRKTRFSPKVEVAVPQAQEVLDEAEAFLVKTFSQMRFDTESSQVVQEDEEEVPAYEQFSADNSSTEQVGFNVDYGEVPQARKRGRKIIIKRL